ncbi:YxeA family protein [Salicibibacter cibarius]|uniref:YxeA family protein n=1 Tax=Salicibibacter cibarius TaxID=2743000 RepID=A0A7T6Z300_9BACI|nr:YxeA family protein [Salicibibacter cibarius]QQK75848.1 YxeA family protein [Salicibibacter cibarius]
MKKVFIVILAFFLFVVAVPIGIYFSVDEMTRVNLNPFTEEEQWYVQVDSEGIIGEEEQGAVYYELLAINEEGEQKDIEFMALNELKEDAYIQLIVEEEIVTTYEEVQEAEVPDHFNAN